MNPAAIAEEARRRYESGERIADIARDLGLPYTTTWNWARGVKIPGRKHSRTTTEAKRERIKNLVQAGEKREWIALEVGVSVTTIWRVMRSE